MKVAVVIDTWFPFVGGGQINAWEISKRLAKLRVEIDIITRNNGKDNLKRVKNLNVYKLGSKSAPGDALSKILFVFKSFIFVSKKDYELVHAHAFLPGITARLLMVFRGIPAIFTVHGTSINTKLNNILSRQLEKFILTQIRYSAQITVSQDFLKIKNINKQSFSTNKKVFYIPNGVDIKEFDGVRVEKAKEPTLIFVGRLHPQKNLNALINALKIARESIPNIRLLIVGEGKLKAELRKQVENLKLEENIKFLGTQTRSDLVKLYKSSHAFILPSIYEGQPLTLLEAWAAKLPVIVSKTGDCEFLVKKGQKDVNGYLIPDPSDVRGLATLIIKAIRNKNPAVLGQNGYNLAKDNFSWDKSAEQVLWLYKRLVNA